MNAETVANQSDEEDRSIEDMMKTLEEFVAGS